MSLCTCHTYGHLVAMLSHYLNELKTAIQCLGIKPKAINKWLQYQGHWTQWHIKLNQESTKSTKSQNRQKLFICKRRIRLLQRLFCIFADHFRKVRTRPRVVTEVPDIANVLEFSWSRRPFPIVKPLPGECKRLNNVIYTKLIAIWHDISELFITINFLRNQNTVTVVESIRRHRYAPCDWLDTLHSIQTPHRISIYSNIWTYDRGKYVSKYFQSTQCKFLNKISDKSYLYPSTLWYSAKSSF